MNNVLRWCWFVLAVAVSVSAAFMYRYEPLPSDIIGRIIVWDRWAQRECIVVTQADMFICSKQELEEFRNKN